MPTEAELSQDISWEIIPAEGRRTIGGPVPLGCLRVWGEDKKAEYLPIPAAVARALLRMQKQQEITVYNRNGLNKLVHDVSLQAARTRVARLLTRRDYSCKEVRDKLVDDGYATDIVREVVASAVSSGLLDDVRFADVFVRSKVYAGWGMRRIERELASRGVDPESLSGWPYEFLDPDDELERAREAAARKQVREPNAFAKMVRFLVGRGFSYDVAKTAAKETLSPSE